MFLVEPFNVCRNEGRKLTVELKKPCLYDDDEEFLKIDESTTTVFSTR
jgi:hypothetical protein